MAISVESNRALETGTPSEKAITRIVSAENFTRRSKRLRRYLGLTAVSVALVLLTGSIIALGIVQQSRASVVSARRERAEAQQERQSALNDIVQAKKDLKSARVALMAAEEYQKHAEDKAADSARRETEAQQERKSALNDVERAKKDLKIAQDAVMAAKENQKTAEDNAAESARREKEAAANASEQQRIAENEKRIVAEQTKRGENLKYSGDMQSVQQNFRAGDVRSRLTHLTHTYPLQAPKSIKKKR